MKIDETGFDADLRALATKIYDEERVPDTIFGRAWREHDLFTAMRELAVNLTGREPHANVLATCEAIGREKAKLCKTAAAEA